MTAERADDVHTGDHEDSQRLADIAVSAATSVGDALRSAFRSQPDVDFKRDRYDPVTVHDKAAEATIREVILGAAPDSRIVGEEGGEIGSGAVSWYVDPIDGTANFAHGLPFFCVSVAAAVGDTVVAGAIYDPMRDDLFVASLDGAWCNGNRLVSAGARHEGEAMLVSGYPSPRQLAAEGPPALDRYGRLLQTYQTVRRPGSAALCLAHVAAGWSDVAVGMSINAWDVAAGALLVDRAGGRYLGLDRIGAPPSVVPWRAPGYLAAVGTLPLDDAVVATVVAETHVPVAVPTADPGVVRSGR
jgi:myo-inositol-1(or 4)-monophosphatase